MKSNANPTTRREMREVHKAREAAARNARLAARSSMSARQTERLWMNELVAAR